MPDDSLPTPAHSFFLYHVACLISFFRNRIPLYSSYLYVILLFIYCSRLWHSSRLIMAQKPLLEAVFNHLVLPAQITLNPTPTSDAPTKAPSKKRVEDDEKIIQEELGDRFSLACQTLSSLVPSEIEVWNAVSSALRATRQVNRDLMSVQTVLQALIHVRDSPDAESWVALYIACQNVSLLVHKDTK